MRTTIFLLATLPLLVSCSHQDVTRMKGGLTIDQNMYLFVGKIEKSGKQICTAVLLDQQWILTFKRCFDENSLSEYRVHFQEVDTGKFITRKLRKTKELKVGKANVILLELSIIIQREVASITVFNKEVKHIKKGTRCIAVGFSSNGKFLNKVKLTVQSPKKCSKPTCKNTLLFDTKNGASICQADNGAPVFCKVENKWLFTALSFVKKGCQKKGLSGLRLSYLSGSIRKAIKEEQETCVRPGCVSAAAQVIERMDKDVDPCENFYQFACGKWLKMNVIPEGFDGYSGFSEMKEDVFNVLKYELDQPNIQGEIEAIGKAKSFYKSCLDTAKITANGNAPLIKVIEKLGGLPLLGQKSGGRWNSSAYLFEDLLVKSFQVTTSLPILSIHVTKVTFLGQERYQLNFDQPTLPLLKGDYLNGKEDRNVKAYRTYLLDIYQEFGANETTAAEYAEYTIELESDLANISLDNPYGDAVTTGVATLPVYGTKVNYKKIVENIYQLAGLSLISTDRVSIYSFSYFREIDNVLKKYPDNVIANYIVSKVVMTHVNFLPQVYRDITRRFLEAVGMEKVSKTRQDFCVEMVVNKMPDVTTRIFVKEGFLKSEERYMLDVAKQHKKVFKKIIEKSEWLSDVSKKAFKEKVAVIDNPWKIRLSITGKTEEICVSKVDNIFVEAGYPNRVYDDDLLNKIHEILTVDAESPFQTSISMARSKMMWELELLKKTIETYDPWSYPPVLQNAFYRPSQNSVALLSGILQPNVYSHDRPEYMNFGAIGMILGHEIVHGFDSNGIAYDKDGKRREWFLQEDIAKFVSKAKCFVDTWSNFTVPGTEGLKNNGVLTFNEVLCDHEGARISYKAYRNKVENLRKGKEEKRLPGLPYTPNQLFFLNMAQSFCQKLTNDFKPYWNQNVPYPVHSTRMNGLMQNSKEFAEAWRCPVGSYMNPADKCTFY